MKFIITTILLLFLSSISIAQEQSTATLSEARMEMNTVTAGSKIIFAGGWYGEENLSSAIDIYDTETNEWSTASLSQADLSLNSGSAGDYTIFLSTLEENEERIGTIVDLYNAETETWSNPELSDNRYWPTIAAFSDKIVVAGGRTGSYPNTVSSDQVDIFDISTQSWSQATLSEARMEMNTVTAGSKIIFAGGWYGEENLSSAIDIYDTETDEWSTASLSQADFSLNSGSAGDYAIFLSTLEENEERIGTIVDLYNAETETWSNPELSDNRYYPTLAALNDKIVIAGGRTGSYPNTVSSDQVDIFTVELPTSIVQPDGLPAQVFLDQNYPNPFNPTTNIRYQVPESAHVTIDVYNVTGQLVATLVNENHDPGFHEVAFDGNRLASGVYIYRMQAGNFTQTKKLLLVK